MMDIQAKLVQWYQTQDEDKVLARVHVECVNCIL